MTYRIRDWKDHYESYESARVKKVLAWVAMPTKHDGKAFRRIMRTDPTGALFGAWCLIVQVAAKCPVRGVLADQDGALSAIDISDKTGLSEESVQRALVVFSSPEIRWIEDSQQMALPSKNNTEHYITLHTSEKCGDARRNAETPAEMRAESESVEVKRVMTPEEMAFVVRTNGGTFLQPPSTEFLKWWELLPPGMKSGQDDCWRYWPTAIGSIMAKHGLDWSMAVGHLIHRTSMFATSDKGKSDEFRWSAKTFLEDGHYDDDPKSWETKTSSKRGSSKTSADAVSDAFAEIDRQEASKNGKH